MRGFVSEQCASRGMVADVAYHDGGTRNPHAQVLLTTRRIGRPSGLERVSKFDRGLRAAIERTAAAVVYAAALGNADVATPYCAG